MDLEIFSGNLLYVDCFGYIPLCMYMYLVLYIHINSLCIGLELQGKLCKRQMKLFWANSEISIQWLPMSESCKVELLLFFFLTRYIGNMRFKCKWRLKLAMKINVLNAVQSALQRNRNRVG